ncbi:helix-turn-helix domain-containing protein [Paenibacillus piri]|uniref:AraC family transcriptional regulator n=1 Tax=Paenibacillus piri TaxID=2547395 RepID=A0A4R5KYX0_9BACL|nr:helix-turn-helix domain-containing protein [Paenibacillus piri]TDG00348.1 AraC family transcriptional regulator [Paenibacillus piri]
MLGKFQFNRRSVLLTWLLSYLAVLLLPVIMSVIVYSKSSETLENEINQANQSLLKQVREVMDNQFEAMERLNFEIMWNVEVRQFLYSDKYQMYPNEYLYDLHKITQDLLMYKTSYSLIDLFYIYLADNKTVLLPDVYRDAGFAYEILHKSSSLTYDRWVSTLNQKEAKGFIPMVRMNESGKERKTVAYISAYPTETDKPKATNVIMIDQSRILRAIDNIELFNKGHVLILNDANQVLVSNSEESERLVLDFPFEKEAGSPFFLWDKDGQHYEVTFIQSDRSKLKYLSIIPSTLFWEKAQKVRQLTYMSIFISLLGGSLLTYFFLRRNYIPVRQLVRVFSDKAVMPQNQGYNEFSFIQEAVDHTLVELSKMMSEQKKQHHILRSNFLGRLLKGKLDGQIPVDESLTAFNMRFETDAFAVILLYMREGAFHERIQQIGSADPQKLMHFIITNVIEELASQKHHGYVAEIDETLACLINFTDIAPDKRMEQLTEIAREAQTFLMSKYHIGLTLSLSGIHTGIAGISQAYAEALDAMEYKLVMGGKEILSYEEIHQSAAADNADTGYYYPLQVEQQLINYVKIGDFEMARRTLDEIIERNFKRTFMSVLIARCLMLNLVSTLIKTISELGDIQDSVLIRNPRRIEKRIEQLINSSTIEDMHMQMTEFLGKVCDYTANKRQQNIQQSRQRALDDRIQQVMDYIGRNYSDSSLNISMIGSHFDMKPAYLSKLFKDHTGEGLLDSINKARIEKAKQLIAADVNKNVSEIAVEVGFNDVNALIRTFKKYEGITPGKYKEMKEQ